MQLAAGPTDGARQRNLTGLMPEVAATRRHKGAIMSPDAVQSRISFIHLAQLTPFRAALSVAVLELGHDTRPISADVLDRLRQAAAAEQGLHAATIEEILGPVDTML